MRSKLHLTDGELMEKSWIALNLEMVDFPWYDPKKKTYIKGKAAADVLSKYIKP
jgi:hypothetical protein